MQSQKTEYEVFEGGSENATSAAIGPVEAGAALSCRCGVLAGAT
jgi:hypothetical protein